VEPAPFHLYQRLLGASFDRLPPLMRRFHAQGDGEAECRFHVRRAPGAFRSAVARLLGLPAPAEDARVALRVRVRGERELWTRVFPDRELHSVQWLENGRLIEQAGLLKLAFDVEADESGMRLATHCCSIAGIPLPRALAPAIAATARGDAHTWDVDVTIALPMLGTMLSYGGDVVPA
jgi:hypothetical protein